jgi:hypothetical protein
MVVMCSLVLWLNGFDAVKRRRNGNYNVVAGKLKVAFEAVVQE